MQVRIPSFIKKERDVRAKRRPVAWAEGGKEDKVSWEQVMRGMKGHGLKGAKFRCERQVLWVR